MIKSYTVDSTYNNMRLDRWIRNKIGNLPQSLIEKSLRSGKVKVNKKKVKSSFKVKYKDVVIRHFAGGQKWRKVWMDLNSPYFKLQKINFFKFVRFYKFKLFLQKLKGYILSKINSFFKTS